MNHGVECLQSHVFNTVIILHITDEAHQPDPSKLVLPARILGQVPLARDVRRDTDDRDEGERVCRGLGEHGEGLCGGGHVRCASRGATATVSVVRRAGDVVVGVRLTTRCTVDVRASARTRSSITPINFPAFLGNARTHAELNATVTTGMAVTAVRFNSLLPPPTRNSQ